MQILWLFYRITHYILRSHMHKSPPAPLACTTLSGIRSLSNLPSLLEIPRPAEAWDLLDLQLDWTWRQEQALQTGSV